MTQIALQYFDGCPNWETTDRILASLGTEGWDITVHHELIDSHAKAVERGFVGSPTVLVDGVDPFADDDGSPALACRIYQTETGQAGSPSIEQLRQVLARATSPPSDHDPTANWARSAMCPTIAGMTLTRVIDRLANDH